MGHNLVTEQLPHPSKPPSSHTPNFIIRMLGPQHAVLFLRILENTKVIIYTDSAYIANCFADKWYIKWRENGWKTSDKQPVKNQDLWTRILALYIKCVAHYGLQIVKVKSHAGNKYNEMVDLLAVKRRKELEED